MSAISYAGKVTNGVVVLPRGVKLNEGQEVEVIPRTASPEEAFLHDAVEACRPPSGLPDDLAANHDYYLHGLSKQQPRRGRWIPADHATSEMTEQECADSTARLLRLAAETRNLPPDLSENHNHYLHGLPKR